MKQLIFISALLLTGNALAAHPPGALRLGPCVEPGISPPAQCGTFTVWENRDTKAGRTIDLNVVVLQATGRDRRPDPIVLLQGGPGESTATTAAAPEWNDKRKHRDILLVDLRGTGRSNPLLCQPEQAAPLQQFMHTLDAAAAKACRAELEKRADLRYYLTPYAMDDLDDLRAALGYEQINIEAGSQGTLSALVYIRQHGKHVRSATLLATTDLSDPMPSKLATDTEGALRLVLRDCVTDAACNTAFPNIEQAYRRAVRYINEQGTVEVQVRDPRNSQSATVQLAAADFAEALRGMLYTPEAVRRVPLLLHRAATTRDYRAFAEAQLDRNMSIARDLAKGLYFAQTCTQDVARVDPKAVYASGRDTFLADHRARAHIEGCEGWPLGRLPAGFGEEVRSDVPVLMINGAMDPATPPATARIAASRLSNVRIAVVPQGGHNTVGLVGTECLDGILAKFLETADPKSLDTACLAGIRRKPFVTKPDEIG
jgi:pimeloyl-ACP methyl ester carboxylesterase